MEEEEKEEVDQEEEKQDIKEDEEEDWTEKATKQTNQSGTKTIPTAQPPTPADSNGAHSPSRIPPAPRPQPTSTQPVLKVREATLGEEKFPDACQQTLSLEFRRDSESYEHRRFRA